MPTTAFTVEYEEGTNVTQLKLDIKLINPDSLGAEENNCF